MNKVHFSSASDNWSTPIDFFKKVEAEFGPFDLDPCADAANAKAPKFFSKDEGHPVPTVWRNWHAEGLKIWMNPPYGRGIGEWVAKAWDESKCGATVVCLLPARTDTKWWHDYVIPHAAEIRFIRGRLKFGGAANSAPFPSALVIFRRTQK